MHKILKRVLTMKKILFSGSIAVMLLLSGCSTKEPAIDATTQDQAGTTEEVSPGTTPDSVDTDQVAVEEGDMTVSGTDETTMEGLESKMQTINFDFDKFDIRADMQERVDANAELANDKAAKYAIKIEGNCDEWGSDEYNYALGLRRANTVKTAMVNQGVAEDRISMVSYGESNPVCTDKTKECWAQNRRVDFKLLP